MADLFGGRREEDALHLAGEPDVMRADRVDGQVELAERLGISRPPVREALRRLGGEGLVEGHSNHGFRVADLGLDAVLRRLEVRAILEHLMAGHVRHAVPHWEPERQGTGRTRDG